MSWLSTVVGRCGSHYVCGRSGTFCKFGSEEFVDSVVYIICKWLGASLWCLYFNSLWPSEALSQNSSVSSLAQVLAWCLMAQSHFLNQSWLTTNEILWYSPEGNFTGNAKDISPWYEFEKYWFKITVSSPRRQWVHYGNITILHQAISVLAWCISVIKIIICCRIWSWSPMLCEKHGPRDSVHKNRSRRPRFLS